MNAAGTVERDNLWWLLLAILLSVGVAAAALKLGQPALVVAGGFAIAAGLFAWSRPFVICAASIVFFSFRLHEAYPSLEPMKLAFLFGTGSIALLAIKALLSPVRPGIDGRALRAYCLISLAACIGAVPYAYLRSKGSVSLDPALIPATMLAAAFCTAAWTLLLSATGRHPLPANMRFLAAFLIWICITTIFSRNPGNSFDWWGSITWKVGAATFATAWLARTERDLRDGSAIFMIGGVLVAAVAIYNKMHGISLIHGARVAIGYIAPTEPDEIVVNSGILSDPNDLALILMFPLSFALARVVHWRTMLEAALAIAASGIILLAITYTQSRGAAIGVVVVFAMLFLQRYRSAFIGLVALAIATPILISVMEIGTRADSDFGQLVGGNIDDSAQHRIDAWKTAVNMAVARPLTGVGVSNFSEMYFSYTNHWHGKGIAAHSMWFQVLGELGFVGLALFVGMIWTSFTINAQTLRWLESTRAPPFLKTTAIGLQAALAATCASGTFLSQAYTMPIYIIVGLIAALSLQARNFVPAASSQTPPLAVRAQDNFRR